MHLTVNFKVQFTRLGIKINVKSGHLEKNVCYFNLYTYNVYHPFGREIPKHPATCHWEEYREGKTITKTIEVHVKSP